MLGSMLIEAGLFIILPWFASNPLCLFGLSMVLCFLREVVYITSENLIQDAIADDLRAMILSVASLVRALFSAMFFSIFGHVLGLYPIQIALNYWCNRDSNYRRCFIKNGRNTGLQELIYRLTSYPKRRAFLMDMTFVTNHSAHRWGSSNTRYIWMYHLPF